MDDLSTTGSAEEEGIAVVPVFTHMTIEIKVNVPALNTDIEKVRAALAAAGIDLSESFQEALVRLGLDVASFVLGVRGLPTVGRFERNGQFEPVETWMRPPTMDWSGAFKRLAEDARRQEESLSQEPPRTAYEFLIQKRERARLTQRKQLRDRVKPWEEKGKRFR